MLYQVWVDSYCYYTLKTLWEAKRKEEIYKQAFPNLTVEVRKKEHAYQ